MVLAESITPTAEAARMGEPAQVKVARDAKGRSSGETTDGASRQRRMGTMSKSKKKA